MSKATKVLLAIGVFYVAVLIGLVAAYGVSTHKNNTFQVQNEFKLVNWVSLGLLSINRAVVYLFLAAILTVVTMVWVADRMQMRPNRVQTAVEALFSLMRDNITRGNIRWLGANFHEAYRAVLREEITGSCGFTNIR